MTFKTPKTKIWETNKIHFFSTIDSTNSEALRRIRAGTAEHGETYIADYQTGGRGRIGRTWETLPQNLSVTFVGQFSLPTEELTFMTLVAGVAVFKTLSHFLSADSSSLSLKWPNDVYWKNKKIAGILSEMHSRENHHWVACGVGVNLNTTLQDFSPDLQKTVTSTLMITKHEISREVFFERLAENFEREVEVFLNDGSAPFVDFVNKHTYPASS